MGARFQSSLGSAAVMAALALILTAGLDACARPPLIVGFVGPLTGPSSAIGVGCRNGVLMGLGKGPGAAPGRIPALSIVVKDDTNDPDACLRAIQDLKAEGCSIVILGTPSHAATKAVPWAVQNQMLVISPTISSPLKGDDSGLFIRGNVPSSDYGIALARAAAQRFHAMRVGFIGDSRNSSYVDAVFRAFDAEYLRLGGRESFVRSFDSSTDRPGDGLVEQIKKEGSDGLVAVAASTEVVLMAKELERAALPIQLFLPPWPLTPDLIQNGGEAVEGAVAVTIADLEFSTPQGRIFESAYRDEYGDEPSFTAMFGWEGAAVLRKALASSPSTTPQALRDRIIAIRDFSGLQGNIVFGNSGGVTRTMLLFRIENGKYRRID